LFFGHANTRVHNGDTKRATRIYLGFDRHFAFARREFNGVRQKVEQNLLDPALVRSNSGQVGAYGFRQAHIPVFC
jgi:hypothetical protein